MQLNSNVTEFILLRLTQDHVRTKIVFKMFLFLYIRTLLGNLLIIATIKTIQALGSPMYFFLFYLSLPDIFLSTCTAPRAIVGSLLEKTFFLSVECMTQVFVAHSLAAWRSSSWSSWLWATRWLVVSPCTTQPSWIMGSVECCWPWPGWHPVWILPLNFFWPWACLSVVPVWFITIAVTWSPWCNLPGQTSMGSTYSWCPIVRPFVLWHLSCWCSPM